MAETREHQDACYHAGKAEGDQPRVQLVQPEDRPAGKLAEDVGSEERFWMLETIREYALERLAEAGEADELHDETAKNGRKSGPDITISSGFQAEIGTRPACGYTKWLEVKASHHEESRFGR